MLNWMNTKELEELELEEKKALGRMRLDWSGSRIDKVCNQWIPSQQFEEVRARSDISIPLLQETLNELIFNQLDVFGKVIEKCGGTGYGYEQLFKVETSALNLFVRLKPVRDEYSYVFVYIK